MSDSDDRAEQIVAEALAVHFIDHPASPCDGCARVVVETLRQEGQLR